MGGPPEVGGGPVHLHTLHIPKTSTELDINHRQTIFGDSQTSCKA